MKHIYIILQPFDYNGLRFPGEIIELTEAEARDLPVERIERTQIETADQPVEKAETAVTRRKKK